jgi:sugar lactone lactonase YvrE
MFNQPTRVTVDSAGNLYVADFQNSVIRKLTPAGANWVVTTLAGKAGQSGYADGTGTNALFYLPNGLTVDGSGNLYVADLGNDVIRKVAADGTVTTIAGLAGHAGFTDGPGSAARFASPSGITLDCAGRLFVADTDYNIIRMLTPGSNWIVTTIGGWPGYSGFANGVGRAASFWSPEGIVADCEGNIYVADTYDNRLRVGHALSADPAITAQPQGQTLVAGMSGTLSVTVTNPSPVTYQWLFNGIALSGQTNATLSLGAVNRTNAGLYSVVVIGTNGGLVSISAQVRVLVRPLLQAPQTLGANGGFRLLFQDSDGGLPQDFSRVALEWRSTLPSGPDTNWQSLSAGLYWTNGFLGWDDTNPPAVTRFYRVLEY